MTNSTLGPGITTKIHEATAKLGAKPNPKAQALLNEARELAFTPVVGADKVKDKEFLALFNPEDPRELYLLKNCVGRLPATASSLPAGEEPHFFEALPLFVFKLIVTEGV